MRRLNLVLIGLLIACALASVANLTTILVTAQLRHYGTTAVAARAAGLPVCSLGRVVVVGQSVPVDVHEVCLDADPQERIRMTEHAVRCFAEGDWNAARAAFDALEARFGSAKTAHAFRDAMDDPSDRRDGVLRLRAK